MIRPTRLLPGAALLAGLLAAAAPAARAAEPDKLIPADADTVISVNLKQLVDSEFAKKFILEDMKKGFEKQEVKQFLTDIGLDPFKDIEKLVVASVETKFAAGTDPNFLIVVRGSFDAEKLFKRAEAETRANPDKFTMVRDGGTVMFKYQPDNEKPAVYATVANDKTVVAGSEKKLVTNALKAADTGKPAPLKKELAELIKKADDKASIYIASVVSGKLGDIPIPQQAGPIKLGDFGKALPSTETALITVRVSNDVALDVAVGMKDEEAANDMRNAVADLLDQLKPLVQLAANFEPQAKALPDLLAAIKVTSKNKDVILTIRAPGDDLGALMKIRPGQRKKKD